LREAYQASFSSQTARHAAPALAAN